MECIGLTDRILALLSRGSITIEEATQRDDGWTPLTVGALRGFPRIVETLLHEGADPSIARDDGATALHIASRHGHLPILRSWWRRPAQTSRQPGLTPLCTVAERVHADVMSAVIEAGSNPNSRLPTTGETALYGSASRGHLGAVRVFLRAKANALSLGRARRAYCRGRPVGCCDVPWARGGCTRAKTAAGVPRLQRCKNRR